MKIAVNTRLLLKNRLEGIGWFTKETLERITRQHPEHTFYFLFDRPFSEEFIFADNVHPLVLSPQARHPVLFYMWFEYSVTRALQKTGADLFLSPDGYLSLRTDTPSVAVIHDLNFEHRPMDLPFVDRKYYHHFFPRFAHKARRIATVSQYSKQDIINCYGVDENKIDVVYNGANESYAPVTETEREHIRQKYTGGKPYFLFIGALLPRKNIARLFQAFDLFKQETGLPHQLMIVGQKKWWTDEMDKCYEGMTHKSEVVFMGRRHPDELKSLLAAAEAMTYVPLFEGFGIPIIEGMRSGVPVICSDTTSMPEVAGDAALLIDPYSIEQIKDAMKTIASDRQLWEQMSTKGQERARMFSWQKTSERLWQCLEKTLNPASIVTEKIR
ncbi:MAG: glycosyltransferase family 4 protein [Flavobacteriales bacterium]|nr:glycosyltransferase family 4 protein [Flavobacteriales bacterium]MCB9446894.1 glycosyltransferase family 4 protein [Flavobacteriales bacterium]